MYRTVTCMYRTVSRYWSRLPLSVTGPGFLCPSLVQACFPSLVQACFLLLVQASFFTENPTQL